MRDFACRNLINQDVVECVWKMRERRLKIKYHFLLHIQTKCKHIVMMMIMVIPGDGRRRKTTKHTILTRHTPNR